MDLIDTADIAADMEAIRDALWDMHPPGTGPDVWMQACHPERIARLLDALADAQRDAERYRWLRDNFTTDSRACGLHACETPQRLDAHIDAAMKEAP